MKKTRWELALIVVMCVVMSLLVIYAGISIIVSNRNEEISAEVYIGFSPETTEKLTFKAVKMINAEKLQKYSSRYAPYNSYTYYKSLSNDEKIIYHAFEYALDHGYPYVLIDEKLVQQTAYDMLEILCFLSLDSAIVEQNLAKATDGYTIVHDYLNGMIPGYEIKGCLVRVVNFASGKLEKKEEALSKAGEIVAQIPDNLTNAEKAQYFYDYLGKNVTYESMEDRNVNDIDFLYEALCMGQTNCDGFTNAFSLLCNMVGIPCFEKMYLPGNGKDGHTWNTVLLDGCWYNADCTCADNDVTEDHYLMQSLRRGFGYSDLLQKYEPMFGEVLPACERELIPIDCYFETVDDPGICEAVKQAYDATARKYVVVFFENGSEETNLLQQFIDTLGFDIHREIRIGPGERVVWYLFNDEDL